MASRRASPWLLGPGRPSALTGGVIAVVGVALATLIIYPLRDIAPVISLSVVYLPAVVFVAVYWGMRLGIATAIVSAAAFNFFQLPPIDSFAVANHGAWASLAAFIVVAVATGLVADLARGRAEEADQRRREADLAADLARLLLGGLSIDEALPLASQRLAAAVGVGAAALELQEIDPTARQIAFPLRQGDERVGTLILPATLGPDQRARVADRVVPALESVLAAALHRARLQTEVVETEALRRSDELKTAVLRSVSHDLRTPVTAILTAVAALDPEHPTPEDVSEVRDVVTHAGTRLARLIEKLLDLTILQSGTLEPRGDWYSIEEVLSEAAAYVDPAAQVVQLSVEPGTPLLKGDAGQMERAFGNLLENAVRYSDRKPVLVRVRAVGTRVRVRIVDQGPGISPQEQERVFLPFYRSPSAGAEHEGSGLGLAIAKGFINAGGGEISVESLPGQGTSFTIDLPVEGSDGERISSAGASASAPAPDHPLGDAEQVAAGPP